MLLQTLVWAHLAISADTTDATFEAYSTSTAPIYAGITDSPSSSPAVWEQLDPANEQDKYKTTITMPISSSCYIFVYQSLDKTYKYNPETDPSYFGTCKENTYANKVIILTPPMVTHISYSITRQNSTTLLVTVTSTDHSIDFLSYNKNFLSVALQNTTYQAAAIPALGVSCQPYYCGTISALVGISGSGNFDLLVRNGNASVIYIKNALTVIGKQTISPGKTTMKKDFALASPVRIPQSKGSGAALKRSPTHGSQDKQIHALPKQRKSIKRKGILSTLLTYVTSFLTIISHVIRSII